MLQRSALVVCLLSALSSFAAPLEPVPAEPNSPRSGLLLQVLHYDGATNGTVTVQVKNPTAAAQDFSPRGLFFVPDVDPDHAPQRLGAVGSLLQKGAKDRADTLRLGPGQSATLMLDVFCIDSHRPSPSSSTPFRVGKERMPRQLSQSIDSNTKAAATSLGGVNAPPAKSAVQQEVWKTRDQKWIKLDGEGSQEANK